VRSTTTINGKTVIMNAVITKTFFWLSTLYKDMDSEVGTITYSGANNSIIRFVELIDIIDVD